MSRQHPKVIARFVFASLVIGGLTFGAQTALGSSGARSECFWHPPTFLGTCSDQPECQSLCEQYNPEPVGGECYDGCCSCVI